MRQKLTQKRHREGYEEGVTILYRPVSALHFIASDSPVEILGKYSRYRHGHTAQLRAKGSML